MGATCASCGTANRDAARFCASCGNRLAERCATCDAELPDGARFCDECGAPVGADDAGDVVDTGSRKLVTILFADLVGSTTAQEQMDPEAVRAENQQAYTLMRAAVERHGGTVIKFVGDGMMAAFGVPDVREDDARRALAAAVDLRSEFGPRMRVGVNTGEVVVADDDNDVVGDAVNVASRLEHDAPHGGVLVGAETYRLTRGDATFEAPRELTVKGRAQPVEARVLVDIAAATAPVASALVGRDAELTLLLGAIGTAEATSEARLVTVIGSPGVGKSRLLAELQQRVGDAAVVLLGRCSAGGAASLEPVADIVRAALDVAGSVTTLDLEQSERDRVTAVVDALLGGGHPGTPQETFWAIRRVIEATARTKPVLVVLDDLHWAEPMLLDVVEHLAEWITGVPVLVVAAGRPELRELRPALVEVGARPAHVVSLEGLDPGATKSLAEELLGTGGLPPEVVARLVGATGGNPLFVRELLRMLVEDGVLRADGDGWSLTVDPDDIVVPETINALLAARIERLAADERVVLERASVLGQNVVRGALAELVPATVRARLPVILETLRRKELLEPAGAYWIDEPVLRFHHVLIRDAAYRRVLKTARAELHERAARWIATKADGEEHDELIGYHLEQSHLSRRDLGDLDDQALAVAAEAGALLGRAARRALHRDQLTAAASLAQRALVCLPDGHVDRAELLLVACEALLETGDTAGARDALAGLGAHGSSDPRLAGWLTAFTVQLDMLSGTADLADAERRAAAAAEALAAIGDPSGAAKCHRVRAAVLARSGRIADSESALDLALTATRQADDRRQISGVLAAAPLAALWGPSPVTRAGGRCLDVVRLLRITTGAREVEAISIRCQALLEAFRGRDEAARSMLDRARTMLEDLGSRHGLIELELFAGMVELVSGEPAAAEEHLSRAEAGYRRMGLHADAARAAALRAGAAMSLGDEQRALELAEIAARVDGSDLTTSVAWRAVKAAILVRRGDPAAAVALAREAVALAEPTDALMDRAAAASALATVLELSGDESAAAVARTEARKLYERKGATAFTDGLADSSALLVSQTSPNERIATGGAATKAVSALRALDAAVAVQNWDAVAELYADDFEFTDQRHLSGRFRFNRDQLLDASRATYNIGPIQTSRVEIVALRGEHLVLSRSVLQTGDAEVHILEVLQSNDHGQVIRLLIFDPEDLDTALATLDRLAAGIVPHNRAVEIAELTDAHLRAGRSAEFAALWDPACVVEDRRSIATFREQDVPTLMRTTEVIENGLLPSRRSTLVAAKGDDLALFAVTQRNGSFTNDFLFLMQANDAGRIVRAVMLDPDDLTAATAELDRCANPPIPNRAARLLEANTAIAAAERWDDLRAAFHPDYVFEDRRPGPWEHTMDSERVIESTRATAPLAKRLRSELVATRGDLLVLLRDVWGSEGYETECYYLTQFDESGLALRSLQFAADDLDAALAELDRLAAEPVGPRQTLATVHARVMTAAMASGRSEMFRWLSRPDCVLEDRRPGPNEPVMDVARMTEFIVAASDIGLSYGAEEVVAIRGEHLALVRQGAGDDHFTHEFLFVLQVDDSGRATRAVLFGPDDLDDAMAELEGLAAAEGIVPHPPVPPNRAVLIERVGRALRLERRFEDLEASMHPDYVVDDRRPIVTKRVLDRGAAVAMMRAMHDDGIAPNDGEVVATRGDELALIRGGYENDGFRADWLSLFQVDDSNRGRRSLIFSSDQMDDAIAELDRLATRPDDLAQAEVVPNRAARQCREGLKLARDGRWDEAVAGSHPDFVLEDRRPVPTEHRQDRVRAIESAAVMDPEHRTIRRFEVLAVHGENLALLRLSIGNEGFGDEWLQIHQIDSAGRVTRIVQFPTDDIDAAMAELDRLAAETGRPTLASVSAAFFSDLMRSSRWDEFRGFMHPDAEFEDRRPLRTEARMRAERTVDHLRAAADAGQTLRSPEVLAVRGERLVLVRQAAGDEHFDDEVLLVLHVDEFGRNLRAVLFGPDDVDDAMAELERLAATDGVVPHPPTPPNLAVLVTGMAIAAIHEDRWDDFRAMMRPDYVFDDRRLVSPGVVADRELVVAMPQAMHTIGARHKKNDTIATRGDSLALLHQSMGKDEFEDEWLCVVQIDESGHGTRFVGFAVEDIGAALAELDRLASADTQPATNLPVVQSIALTEAMAAGRWDHFRVIVHPDYVMEDHRSGPTERMLDYERAVSSAMAFADVGITFTVEEVIATRGEHLALLRHGAGSANFRDEWLGVHLVDESGRELRSIFFDAGDVAAARGALDHLGDEHGVVPSAAVAPNRAVLTNQIGAALIREGRWDGVESLMNPAYTFEDRRAVSAGIMIGSSAVVAMLHEMAHEIARDIETETIATRGDNLAVLRHRIKDATFDDAWLGVQQVDDLGRSLRYITFGSDDLDAALAELDRLDAGATTHPVLAAMRQTLVDIKAGDREAFLATMHPSYRYVDRRQGGFHLPSLDSESVFDGVKAAFDLGHTIEVEELIETRGERLVLARNRMGTPNGFHSDSLLISRTDPTGLTELTLEFDAHELDDAVQALDSLATALAGNIASSAHMAGLHALNEGRWQEFAAGFTDDFVWESRRKLLGIPVTSREDVLRAAVATNEQELRIHAEPVAARGDQLVVLREILDGAGDTHEEFLVLVVTDGSGKQVRCIQFDIDDLGTALTELDTVAEQAGEHLVIAAFRRGAEAIAAGRWGELRATMHADFLYTDRRRSVIAAPALDRDRVVEVMRMGAELGITVSVNELIDSRGDRLALMRNKQGTTTGFASETLLLVRLTDDGLIDLTLNYDTDQVADARRDLDALGEGLAGNTVARVHLEQLTAYNERRFDGIGATLADNLTFEIRRPLSVPVLERDEVLAAVHVMAEQGVTMVARPLAACGERHTLLRERQITDVVIDDYLLLAIADDADLQVRFIQFDRKDLDAALTELHRLASGFQVENMATRAFDAVSDALVRADADAVRAVLAPGFTCEERREGITVAVDSDAIIADLEYPDRMPSAAELEPLDLRGERLALVRARYHGHDSDFDAVQLHVIEVDDLGRITRAFNYRDDGLDEARVHLDRLAGEQFDNHAVRVAKRTEELACAGRWAEYREQFHPSFTYIDRRPNFQAPMLDLDGLMLALEEGADLGMTSLRLEPVEVRGERLVLLRQFLTGAAGFEIEDLVVSRCHPDGRPDLAVHFDASDLDAARAELDALATADDFAARGRRNRAILWLQRWRGSTDWRAYRSACSAWYAGEDRRPILRAAYDLEGHIEAMRATEELQGRLLGSDVVAVHGDGVALVAESWGAHTTTVNVLIAISVDGDGRKLREIVYDPAQRDEAVAALPALAEPENTASRLQRRCNRWILAGDIELIAAACAPDLSVDDRRQGRALTLQGAATLDDVVSIRQAGFDRVDTEVLAVHGERAALMRHRYSVSSTGWFDDVLQVLVLDDEGLGQASTLFDVEDLDAALAELDALDQR